MQRDAELVTFKETIQSDRQGLDFTVNRLQKELEEAKTANASLQRHWDLEKE